MGAGAATAPGASLHAFLLHAFKQQRAFGQRPSAVDVRARGLYIATFAQSQDEAQDEAQWLQNVIQRIDAREGKKSVSAPMTIEPKRMLPKSIVAGVHKTELCPSLRRKGTYAYGSACVFAHGESDLKPRHRDGRWACLTLGAKARQADSISCRCVLTWGLRDCQWGRGVALCSCAS